MLKSDHKILILLIGLTIIRGFIYISITPPWLGPDEATHFEAIRLIGQEGMWPTREVYLTTPMHPEMYASFERFQVWQLAHLAPPPGFSGHAVNIPYIYYYPAYNAGGVVEADRYPLIYHLLLSPISGLSRSLDIDRQLYLLRFFSLFFVNLTIVAGWFFGRAIFPDKPIYAIAVAVFLIFLPMHMHSNTCVNTDVFVTLLVSIYFWMLAKIFGEGRSLRRIAIAGIILVIAILTKPTALFIIPTTGAAMFISLARQFRWTKWFWGVGLTLLVVFTGLMSFFFYQVTGGGRALGALFSVNTVDLGNNYLSQESLAIYIYTIQWGFLSFWGLFGWADIPLPGWWTWVLWRVCLLIGVGIVIFWGKYLYFKPKSDLKSYQKDFLLVLLLSLIFAFMEIYTPILVTQSATWGPPSRYLFPALLPLSLYFFLGFQQLIPAPLYKLALPLWLTGWVAFDSLVLMQVLIPALYG